MASKVVSPPIWYVVPETSVNDRRSTAAHWCRFAQSASHQPQREELRSMDSLNA